METVDSLKILNNKLIALNPIIKVIKMIKKQNLITSFLELNYNGNKN